jgi:hypothetical protein
MSKTKKEEGQGTREPFYRAMDDQTVMGEATGQRASTRWVGTSSSVTTRVREGKASVKGK